MIDAAQRYFHKTPRELTLAEAATLAGIPRRPSDYSPAVDSAAAQARRNHVLAAMLPAGSISRTAHDAAVAETATVFAD